MIKKRLLQVHFAFKKSPRYRSLYGTTKTRLMDILNLADLQMERDFCAHYTQSPLAPQVIIYESFHASSVSCSPAALFDAALKDPRFAGFTHVWVIDVAEAVPARFARIGNVKVISRASREYPRYLATAGYLVNNSTFPSWYLRRDGQVYLNTWHGIPLKTMFRDENGPPARFANSQRNFLQASHIVLAGDYATQHLLGSAQVAPLCTRKTWHIGTARIDRTLAVRADWRADPTRRHILFAPTWKGEIDAVISQLPEIEALVAALSKVGGTPITLHIKAHNFNFDDLSTLPRGSDRLTPVAVDPQADVNLIMADMDMVITDYSSLLFDALAVDIPTVLFMPDLAAYQKTRGLYIAPETLPAAVCYDAATLRSAVTGARAPSDFPDDIYQAARATYFPDEDGQASARTLDVILGAETAAAPISSSTKPVLALMMGGFLRNGITTSALNLLTNIDTDRFDVMLLTDGTKMRQEAWDMIARVPDHVMVVHRMGHESYTAKEDVAKKDFYANNRLNDPDTLLLMERAMAREARRIMGPVTLEAAIDFSGYQRMWAWIMAMSNARQKIIYQHNDMSSERNLRYDVLEGVFFIYRYYNKVVAVSEETQALNQSNLSEYYGDAEPRAVRNTLNIAGIREAAAYRDLTPEAINFITIGRCSAEKNHAMLLEAFAMVHASTPRARLLILGDGPLLSATRKLRDRLGLTEVVQIPGFSGQALSLLDQASCFVLPSLYEGQPMVILEALTLGKPVIVTDIPGSRGALRGGYGYIAEDTSAENFAQAMLDFCAGRLQFKTFDAQAYNAKAVADFDALLEGSGDAT
ncbi:MAG: CDP-glycerol glycerophosphotransferase [Paracoccaceae bacterium]|jgi:CDP-glycerol glycerophosphotransferase